MVTATHSISLEEYLHTSYSPDCEYIDGEIVERNVGKGKVPCVWVIDPWLARAWIFDLDQPPREVQDGRLIAPGLGIAIQLSDVLPPASA